MPACRASMAPLCCPARLHIKVLAALVHCPLAIKCAGGVHYWSRFGEIFRFGTLAQYEKAKIFPLRFQKF